MACPLGEDAQVRGNSCPCTQISELTAAPICTKACGATYLAWKAILHLPLQVVCFLLQVLKNQSWGVFLVFIYHTFVLNTVKAINGQPGEWDAVSEISLG